MESYAGGHLAFHGQLTSFEARESILHAGFDGAHSFTIDSEQVRILVQLTPVGGEGFFKACSVPAPSMTLPPATETPYSEKQKMIALAPEYGMEFVIPNR